MNLDDLISKYLDGELKEDEDKLLRSMTADDKESKDTFYSSVIIKSACREDANSIVPPADFLQETESKIMMRILAEQPLVEEKLYKDYSKNRKVLFSAALVGVLILGFFRISDFGLLNYKPMLLSMLYEERAKIEKQSSYSTEESRPVMRTLDRNIINNISTQNSTLASRVNPSAASKRNFLAAAISNVNSQASAVNSPVLANTAFGEVETIAQPDNVLLADVKANNEQASGTMSIPAFHTQSESLISTLTTIAEAPNPKLNLPGTFSGRNKSTSMIQNNSTFDFYPVKTDIQLGSFFGSDMVRMGLDVNKNDKISHFSQSIGYPVYQNNFVGIEFGYTQYNYDDKIFVSLPVSSKSVMTTTIEVRNPGDEEGVALQVPLILKREKQIVWGSAYYERRFIEYSGFTLNGRMGVGASSDGMLSFGRLFGKYELFPGFAITIGADARLFKARLVTTNEVSDGWRGTASLIYGFQLKF